ncbi:MAG: hypothetical protein GY756_02555 [bacterium]|nr:hypothetical protein [bacterium]
MVYSKKEKKYIIITSIISIICLLITIVHFDLKNFGLYHEVSLQKYCNWNDLLYDVQLIFILMLFSFLYFSVKGVWKSHIYGEKILFYIISIVLILLYLFFNYPYTTWPGFTSFGWTILNCFGIVLVIIFLCFTMKRHK